ncbi:MAG: CoA pyrophosphatase [Burkholderiaceae bacterium]
MSERFLVSRDWQQELISDRTQDSPADERAAAVLIPVLSYLSEPEVLLTVRPAHLRTHAGQIAFPGGAVEADDADRTATALREAREEIGVTLGRESVLGQMPAYKTGSGFAVTPVIALIEQELELKLDHNEVAETFSVPLSFLMDPANHQRLQVDLQGGSRMVYAMPWIRPSDQIEFYIWGVTAAILRNFYHYLRD